MILRVIFLSLFLFRRRGRYIQHDTIIQLGHERWYSGVVECRVKAGFHVGCELLFVGVGDVVEGVLCVCVGVNAIVLLYLLWI